MEEQEQSTLINSAEIFIAHSMPQIDHKPHKRKEYSVFYKITNDKKKNNHTQFWSKKEQSFPNQCSLLCKSRADTNTLQYPQSKWGTQKCSDDLKSSWKKKKNKIIRSKF